MRAVGMAFQEITPELRTTLQELTKAKAAERVVTEPIDAFDPISDAALANLRAALLRPETLKTLRVLVEQGTPPVDTPRWLAAASTTLSEAERALIQSSSTAPAWASDALLCRLRAFQARSRVGSGPPTDTDVREVLGICRRLAEAASSADEPALVQVASIRGEVLRTLYDPASAGAVD
jgi:hypothetical protein